MGSDDQLRTFTVQASDFTDEARQELLDAGLQYTAVRREDDWGVTCAEETVGDLIGILARCGVRMNGVDPIDR